MKYQIFIDESGSLSFKSKKRKNFFVVSFLIVEASKALYLEQLFYKFIMNNSVLKNIFISKKEIKGNYIHQSKKYRKANNKLSENIIKSLLSNINYWHFGYIDNTQAAVIKISKESKDKIFYGIIEFLLERAFDKKILQKNDELEILYDEFGFNCRSRTKGLSKYFENKLSKKYNILLSINSVDSKKKLLIQLADVFANKIHYFLKISKKQKNTLNEKERLTSMVYKKIKNIVKNFNIRLIYL